MSLKYERAITCCTKFAPLYCQLTLSKRSWSLKSDSAKVMVARQVMFACSSFVTRSFTTWKTEPINCRQENCLDIETVPSRLIHKAK